MATPPPGPRPRSGRYPRAYPVFFLLACLYGAAAVPAWVAEWDGWIGGCLHCDAALRHGHEMLLGYAGAIIAGYLLTRVTRGQLALAVGCWCLGRIAAWEEWGGIVGAVAGLSFPVVLFALGGMPFWRAARTARNMVFAPLIAGFAVAEGLVVGGHARGGVLLAFDLVTLLILVMGGRLIPAAMAGLVRREESRDLFDRNRPWLEGACVAGLAVAATAHVLSLPGGIGAAGDLVAAMAAWMRQSRWRPRLAASDSSLGPLQLGYFLLAAGLAAVAASTWTMGWPVADALHVTTIGGFGVTTTTMMLRTVHIRERHSGPFSRWTWTISGILVAAAVSRAVVSLAPALLLPASAALWSCALLATAVAIATGIWGRKTRA